MADDCRVTGHLWPVWPSEGIFAPGFRPPSETVTETCSQCGTVRITHPDGSREYLRPSTTDG